MCKKQNLWPLRLKLERAIWSQNAPVLALNGFLSCPRGDHATQALVSLYNRLFGETNRKWLEADNIVSRAETLEFWVGFELEKKRLGPLWPAPAGVVWALARPRSKRRLDGVKWRF